jgi:hypothetical protein
MARLLITIEIVYPRSISGAEPYEDDDVYSHLRNDAIFSPDDFLCSLFFGVNCGRIKIDNVITFDIQATTTISCMKIEQPRSKLVLSDSSTYILTSLRTDQGLRRPSGFRRIRCWQTNPILATSTRRSGWCIMVITVLVCTYPTD